MNVKDFDTEKGFDLLEVDGKTFSGSLASAPHGIQPMRAITWRSDHAKAMGGWNICPTEATPSNTSTTAASDTSLTAPPDTSPSDFSIWELFDRPLFAEDDGVGSIFQEWQTWVGIGLLGTIFIGKHLITKGLVKCQGQKVNLKQVYNTFPAMGRLWESAGHFFLLFAMLKHSPQFALVFVLLYFLLYSLRFCLCSVPRPAKFKHLKLQPVSVYTDLEAGNIIECFAMLGGQIMLYCLVALTVYDQDNMEGFTDQQVFFFCAGALASAVLRTREHSFLENEWKPFWKPYFEEFYHQYSDHWPRLRLCWSVLVNEVFAQMVLILLPVVLMNAPDLMEFVKDATCVAFISHLDNFQNAHLEDSQEIVNEALQQEQEKAKKEQEDIDMKAKMISLFAVAEAESLKERHKSFEETLKSIEGKHTDAEQEMGSNLKELRESQVKQAGLLQKVEERMKGLEANMDRIKEVEKKQVELEVKMQNADTLIASMTLKLSDLQHGLSKVSRSRSEI